MEIPYHKDWQIGKTVLECNKYMLDHQIYCDVTFQVGMAGRLMRAHKYVLSSRSSVFAAMFYGSLPETSDVIVVSDIEPVVFDILLRFLYYEDQELSCKTVIGVLYAAEKYAVTGLVKLCQGYLESNITEETVCDIIENARIFNMTDSFTKCLHFICKSQSCAQKVFESLGFLWCSRESLVSLVKADELPLDEKIIYQSLIRWAMHRCKKDEIDEEDSAEIRKTLGNLIFHVRFPLMSLKTFWEDVANKNILSAEEKVQISQLITGKRVRNPAFATTARQGLGVVEVMRIMRVNDICTDRMSHQHGKIDAIEFEVSKPLILRGLLLYGSANVPYTYMVEAKVLLRSPTLLHFSEKSISGSTQQFKIVFDRPCHITAKERYTLWVKLTGPDSYQGNYSVCVNYDDFTFVFHKSGFSNNGTNISTGQIPGILCSMER